MKSIKLDKLTLGVCYYPEHWPESLWEEDLDRMLSYGIEVVRIAEFAWNKFEPEEGKFTFEFFDRFLALAEKKGMKVIFCTPTATPPAWLTTKYPEVLNAKEDGTLLRHGLRRHYNYNSPQYQEFTKRMVEQLASHYCSHPSVVGWQIDNELNCECNVFYSEADQIAFRTYLKEKFKTLDAFNEAMGTVFWNQTYTDWDQVYLKQPTTAGNRNPHLALEEKRFISYSAIRYCKLQSDLIRKYKPEQQFITTNGIFGHLDSHEMTEEALDFITYDNYPNFSFAMDSNPKEKGCLNDRGSAWALTRARSISDNFGIMEQQSGAGGWDTRMLQPMPKPGQMRLWTFQSIAHGADYISFFRWRTCWVGTEIYWHGLNDYSNEPNRRVAELGQIHEEVKKLQMIAGSKYQAKIAMIKDYDNEWDGEEDRWHGPLDWFSNDGWFKASQRTHTPMNFIYLQDNQAHKTSLEELIPYDCIIYPHATILTEETANLLTAYVKQGGKLILGARTGYKDKYGRCPMQAMPGFASELCGVRVSDYTLLGPGDDQEWAVWDGEEIEAPVFNDVLEARDGAKVLAAFKGNYYDGQPALVSNQVGKGTAYYYGAGFSEKTATVFLKKLGVAGTYDEFLELPEEVELAVRKADGVEYFFVLNFMPYEMEAVIKKPMRNLLSGQMVEGKIKLENYGIIVLENKESFDY